MVSSPKTEQLRVLLWSPKGAGRQYGGPGMNAWRLYSALPNGSLAVSLLHGSSEQETVQPFSPIVSIWPKDRYGLLGKLLLGIHASLWITKNRAKFDVFHGLAGYWTTLLPALAAKMVGMAVVIKIAGEGTETTLSGEQRFQWLRRGRHRLLKHIDAVVAISDSIEARLLDLGVDRRRIHRIPNGVNTEVFYPAVAQEPRIREDPIVLFCGAIVPRKRPHLLVNVLKCQGMETISLWVAGPRSDEAYASSIFRLAHSLGVADRVRWLGFVQETAPLYRHVDIVCLPSRSEGMANVLLEAMASGCPFVATMASGVEELAATGAGIVAGETADEIATALRLGLKKREQMGEAGLDAVNRIYSSTVIAENYLALFRRLVRSDDSV